MGGRGGGKRHPLPTLISVRRTASCGGRRKEERFFSSKEELEDGGYCSVESGRLGPSRL